MKKFKLNLNNLKVESFETSKVSKPKGTILGNNLQEPSHHDSECNCDPTLVGLHCEPNTGYYCGFTNHMDCTINC